GRGRRRLTPALPVPIWRPALLRIETRGGGSFVLAHWPRRDPIQPRLRACVCSPGRGAGQRAGGAPLARADRAVLRLGGARGGAGGGQHLRAQGAAARRRPVFVRSVLSLLLRGLRQSVAAPGA